MQVDAGAQKFLDVGAGGAADFFQHLPALANDHAFVALFFADDAGVNVDEVGIGALLEPLHRDGDAVGHLLPQEQQRLLPDQLGHKLLFRQVGESILIKIVGAFVAVGRKDGKQFLTAGAVFSGNRDDFIKAAEFLDLPFAGL